MSRLRERTPNVLSAKVDANGTFLVGHVALGSQRLATGTYRVRFNRDVRNCTMTATARERAAFVSIDKEPLNPQAVLVRTKALANVPGGVLLTGSNSAFDLWGVC